MSLTWGKGDVEHGPAPVSQSRSESESVSESGYKVVSWLLFWLVASTVAWIGIIGLVKWAIGKV